jgi:pilus assembly protein CpaB
MKLKTMVLLAMALGCGLVAMVGVQQVLAERKSSGGNKVSVLVARMEIDAGAELKEENVAFEEREDQTIPQGAVTDPEQYKRRATTVRLFPGELILQAKMGEPGVIGVAAQIPKGMRVVAVPVNATSSISGMVTAGNKVDIVLTYARQKNGVQFKKTKTILTNIEIFSVDKVRHQDSADASKASAKPENVSLLVTPQQAQTLSYATQNGQLQLTLRSTTDDVAVETTEIDDEAFEGIDTDEGVKVSEEDPAEPAPTKVSNTQMSGTEQDRLKAFLNPNVPAPSESVPMPSMDTPPAAPKNTWSITIYDGEEKRVETLEIVPEREAPDTEPAKSEPTASAATPEKSGGADVGSWLRRLISEPKTKTDKSKTTQQAAPNLELPAEAKAS